MLKNTIVLSRSADVLVTASGGKRKSANIKTGPMIQIQAATTSIDPVTAVQTGADSAVCFSCALRPFLGGECYVVHGQGPLATWKAAQDRQPVSAVEFDVWAKDRPARLGSYGDPAAMPVDVLESVTANRRHTGYSSQWREPKYQYLAEVAMASVQTVEEREHASALGWRTYRVLSPGQGLDTGETMCPFESSGGKVQCADCMLCAGNSKQAKDIAIPVHGGRSANYVR